MSLASFQLVHPDTGAPLKDHVRALRTERSWTLRLTREFVRQPLPPGTGAPSRDTRTTGYCIFSFFLPPPLSSLQRASSAGLPPAAFLTTLWFS